MDYIAITQADIAEKYPIIVYAKPQLSDLPTGAIIGTFAYSVPNHIRYIIMPDKEIAPGVLPADLARTWIKDEFNIPVKVRKAQLQSQSYPLPFFAHQSGERELAYVDIRHAYVNILALGYNVEYLRGKYIGARLTNVPKQIRDNKMSYAVAVAMSNSKLTNISIMGKKGVFQSHAFNIYSNPCLYNLARDILSSIASEAYSSLGEWIHYVNTDGFIIDRAKASELLAIIASWGFEARVKYEGQGEVYGVGSWKIEGTATKRRDYSGAGFTRSPVPTNGEAAWMKKRIVKFMDVIHKENLINGA